MAAREPFTGRIQVFTTGGTLDKVYFDDLSTYTVGEPQIVDILRGVNVQVPFDVETLMRKDSIHLTTHDRSLIEHACRQCSASRILITHGTDTMIETARDLQGLGADKTIVLVGSLSPARFKGTDAEFNIGFAWAVVQTAPPGIYIAMNGRVFDAAHVRKNRDENRFEQVQGE